MKRYGSKTRKISISLVAVGIILAISSLFLMESTLFEGILALSLVFVFSGFIIYVVIYREFEKLEKIAEEVEKGKI